MENTADRNDGLSNSFVEKDYQELLHDTISVIESSRVKMARQINMTVMSSHWEIGRLLEERKLDSKHGDSIVRRLSVDLKKRYPNMGVSPRNLWNMKRFYLQYYQCNTKVQRSVALLPWRHNLLLLEYDLSEEHVLFYANEVLNKGWSKDMLNLALKSSYHLSLQASEKSNNFALTMSNENAAYANEIFRSRYHLGFIDAVEPLKELDLERHLVNKITSFIMELGNGFSFIGNQYTLSFNNKEYHVDLLFFHRRLRSMVAIELKIGEFKPEYVGKMNFYLSLLDKLEKSADENPSIGIILCANKEHIEVELALQGINKPIGVAEFQYLLPKNKLEELITNEIKKRDETI